MNVNQKLDQLGDNAILRDVYLPIEITPVFNSWVMDDKIEGSVWDHELSGYCKGGGEVGWVWFSEVSGIYQLSGCLIVF
jgi:hypothetical protein